MRVVIPGVTLVALGFQAILGGFLVSVFENPRALMETSPPGRRASEFDRYAGDYEERVGARAAALGRGQLVLRP